MGVSIGWFPIFGWIPLAFAAHNADNLQKAWAKLENSYNELTKRNKNEATLITFVESMVKQFDGLLDKIDAAISAVGDLSKMFEDQSQAYTVIRDGLSDIKNTTTEEDATNRKIFIDVCINQTVEQIQDVSSLLPSGDILPVLTFSLFLPKLQTAGAGFVEAILTENQDVFKKPAA